MLEDSVTLHIPNYWNCIGSITYRLSSMRTGPPVSSSPVKPPSIVPGPWGIQQITIIHYDACNFSSSFFFFSQYWGLSSGSSPWDTPPVLFLWRVFQDRASQTIWPGWLWTTILLISWIVRITDLSLWHPMVLAIFFPHLILQELLHLLLITVH
jgi:hypothetical protein